MWIAYPKGFSNQHILVSPASLEMGSCLQDLPPQNPQWSVF
jgi:hypothetical protein